LTCAAFFPHVKKLLADNPDKIRLSVRHVPFHKGSDQVVRILEAARNQGKYLPTLEALYASQGQWVVHHEVQADRVWPSVVGLGLDLERLRNDMTAPEIARRMEQDMGDARALGVTKTPEFFVNGRPMPSFGLEELQDLVKEELGRAYP
jgi:protein-disulfide isomerase